MDSQPPEDYESTKAALEEAIRANYAKRGCGCNPDMVWSLPDSSQPHQQHLVIWHAEDCVIARAAQSKWN